jgi:hypothetical protein
MRRLGLVALSSLLAMACGGSSDSSGAAGKGGSAGTGAASGSGGTGASAGSGAYSGSGGLGGDGGAYGGSAGAVAGGGGAATGGAAGGSATAECTQDSDCKPFEDCCTCSAVPVGENPSMCKSACTEKKCAVLGVSPTAASCVAGRCVKGFECDATKVACAAASPVCDPGEVPQVSGACWTGACVPAEQCASVTSCATCATANFACAAFEMPAGPEAHCVSLPAVCAGNATCACLGPSVCLSPYSSCSDFSGVMGVACGCPTC